MSLSDYLKDFTQVKEDEVISGVKVKEFIRKLKKRLIENIPREWKKICEIIYEEAGEELI